MTTKLTPGTNQRTIERAGALSATGGMSISKMVENYPEKLTENEEQKRAGLSQLSGILKGKLPKEVEWKKIKEDHLMKKYCR